MKSIGYRRSLSFLMTLMHVVIILIMVRGQQPHMSEARQKASVRTVGYQENTAVPFEPIRPPQFTAAQKVDLLLNYPAFLAAIPVALVWHHESDLFLFYAATAFVQFVWFGVGRWIDMRVGYLAKTTSTSRMRRVVVGTALVLAPVWFLLGFIMVTPLNHHRNVDAYWMGATMMLWSALALAMALVRGRTRPATDSLVVP